MDDQAFSLTRVDLRNCDILHMHWLTKHKIPILFIVLDIRSVTLFCKFRYFCLISSILSRDRKSYDWRAIAK